MSDPTDTVSETEEELPSLDEWPVIGEAPRETTGEDGDSIDDSRLRQKTEPPPPPRDATGGIPKIEEWQDFFSRIVLRVGCDWYINWAFRGVDENDVTDRELDRLQMTDEERKRIATPLAEVSHKSKIMRRHGRTIVASGGLFDALVALGTWTSRVNRIARRHRPVHGRVVNERSGQTPSSANGTQGANGGTVGNDWIIVNPGG